MSKILNTSNLSLTLYITVTLFLGESVLQKMGLSLGEGIIGNSHFVALPILVWSVIKKYRKLYFTKNENILFVFSVICVIMQILLGRSANFAIILNTVFEPILLFAVLRTCDKKTLLSIQRIFFLFYIVECLIAILEAATHTIFFADISEYMERTMNVDMRAYSLHGHPLANAFLVSLAATFILSSNMNIYKRYFLFVLGFTALFAFNTRSSVYFLSVILVINIVKDLFSKRNTSSMKILLISFIMISIALFLNIISEYNLGSRLSVALDSNDDSSNARFILIKIISSLSIDDLIFGYPSFHSLLVRYSLVAIENSIICFIFYFGLIFSVGYFFLFYNMCKSIQISKFMFYMTSSIVFLLLNTNNILVMFCPIIPYITILLFIFKNEKSHNIVIN